MRKILIRFDDICPTMNFEEFDKAIDLMDELDIKPLIGVIPKCEDDILKIDAPKMLVTDQGLLVILLLCSI